ncbi:MAG: uvrD2, partial [Ilumatobacteraceae bacterium]|nr:uvrD2 [Ilumatobacteraceae bacterium]
MDPQRLLIGLDADQRAAVTTSALPLAVIAAAGSGKTTVLTQRIAHRIVTESAEAKHTLALTFTRDAAGELKRRLRRLELRDPIEAGTFHSVALRLLRDRALTRNEQMPQIATDRLRLMRECMTELRLDVAPYLAIADVDWARARMLGPESYEAACRRERRRSAVPAVRLAEVAGAYERLKRRRGVIDFDDLLERTLDAMRGDPVFADVVRWRFRHFYVDEAQDLNPLQHALLEAWRDRRPDLCLVGDPRQAIYGWNGADHTTLANVEDRYPGVTVLSLTTNYRCTPQVVRAGSAALAAGGLADDTRSDRPDGLAIAVREYATELDEAIGVARQVRAALNHRAGSDIAVLARTNDQLTELQRALAAAGVPTERAVGRSPL